MKRITTLLLSIAVCLLSCSCKQTSKPPLAVIFFDVGQGDATLIRTPDGDVLIDAGPEASQELLCLRLEQLGVRKLILAVFTHMDEDHIGGADGVLSRFPTNEVWVNGDTADTLAQNLLFETAEHNGTVCKSVSAGHLHNVGDLKFTVLHPSSTLGDLGNEDSIVLRIGFGETVMIFSGDAGSEQEEWMLSHYGKAHLDCSLYKVGHHGSNTSSSAAFLTAMTPDFAVISCGASNSFGHPTGEVLKRLESVGAEILRTDRQGEIVLYGDGERLWRAENE